MTEFVVTKRVNEVTFDAMSEGPGLDVAAFCEWGWNDTRGSSDVKQACNEGKKEDDEKPPRPNVPLLCDKETRSAFYVESSFFTGVLSMRITENNKVTEEKNETQ